MYNLLAVTAAKQYVQIYVTMLNDRAVMDFAMSVNFPDGLKLFKLLKDRRRYALGLPRSVTMLKEKARALAIELGLDYGLIFTDDPEHFYSFFSPMSKGYSGPITKGL